MAKAAAKAKTKAKTKATTVQSILQSILPRKRAKPIANKAAKAKAKTKAMKGNGKDKVAKAKAKVAVVYRPLMLTPVSKAKAMQDTANSRAKAKAGKALKLIPMKKGVPFGYTIQGDSSTEFLEPPAIPAAPDTPVCRAFSMMLIPGTP